MTEGGAFGCIPDLGNSHSNRAVSTLLYLSLPFSTPFVPLRAPSCPFVDILPQLTVGSRKLPLQRTTTPISNCSRPTRASTA